MRTFFGLVVLSLAAGLGCGGDKKGSSKVSGTVNYEGTPLPSGTVTFFDAKQQIVGSASIQNGNYVMEGVPTGKVAVTVTTPPPIAPNTSHRPKDMPGDPPVPVVPIPPIYGNPQQSGLSYDVKPGSQDYPIELR